MIYSWEIYKIKKLSDLQRKNKILNKKIPLLKFISKKNYLLNFIYFLIYLFSFLTLTLILMWNTCWKSLTHGKLKIFPWLVALSCYQLFYMWEDFYIYFCWKSFICLMNYLCCGGYLLFDAIIINIFYG